MQVAVEAVSDSIQWDVDGLYWMTVSERVRPLGRAADIGGAYLALRVPASEFLLCETVAITDSEVVEVLRQLCVVVARHCHLHARHGLLHKVLRVAHGLLTTLIHRDAGFLEPSFFLQMLGERLQELRPKLLISRAVGLRLQVDELL